MNAVEWSRFRLLVLFLLALQAVSVALMWSLNPLGMSSEASFALLLAADLVAFTIVSYIARLLDLGSGPRGVYILIGAVAALVFVSLAVLR